MKRHNGHRVKIFPEATAWAVIREDKGGGPRLIIQILNDPDLLIDVRRYWNPAQDTKDGRGEDVYVPTRQGIRVTPEEWGRICLEAASHVARVDTSASAQAAFLALAFEILGAGNIDDAKRDYLAESARRTVAVAEREREEQDA